MWVVPPDLPLLPSVPRREGRGACDAPQSKKKQNAQNCGFPLRGRWGVLSALAKRQIFLGTSSWKYTGWLEQIYSPERYRKGRLPRRIRAACPAQPSPLGIIFALRSAVPLEELAEEL